MKLYECDRNTKVRVVGEIKVPPSASEIKQGDIITFLKIDGMYSYCYNEQGEVVHLVAWAEVEPVL